MNSPVINIDDCQYIKCSNCDKKLLIVPSYDRSKEILYELTVQCPFCGDNSFKFEVKGPLKYYPAEGVKITDFSQNNKSILFSTKK